MATNLEGYLGDYSGADSRKKNGIWFKSTHFSLGQDKSQHHYSHSQREQLGLAHGVKREKPPHDANSMTRTQFILGDAAQNYMTTTKANYQAPPDAFRLPKLDQETINQKTGGNIDFGGHPQQYSTTHQREYQDKKSMVSPGELAEQKER